MEDARAQAAEENARLERMLEAVSAQRELAKDALRNGDDEQAWDILDLAPENEAAVKALSPAQDAAEG